MSVWRKEALGRLPEFRSLIESARNPMSLWIELSCKFREAVERQNHDLIKRMLQYASWCFSRENGQGSGDIINAVACAFYEHLPQNKQYWPLFENWFFPHEFEALLPIFEYHTSPQELSDLKRVYYEKRKA